MEYKPQRISKLIEDIETFFILTNPIKIEIEKNKILFPIKVFGLTRIASTLRSSAFLPKKVLTATFVFDSINTSRQIWRSWKRAMVNGQ